MVGKLKYMQHEKIFTHNPNKDIKVVVSIWTDHFRDDFGYNHQVSVRDKGKRKFVNVDDYQYEQLVKDGLNNIIEAAKLELWEKLKP